jgi:hypothetical protein
VNRGRTIFRVFAEKWGIGDWVMGKALIREQKPHFSQKGEKWGTQNTILSAAARHARASQEESAALPGQPKS